MTDHILNPAPSASAEHAEFVRKLCAVAEPTPFSLDGMDLVAFPEVFSPLVSNDTAWFCTQLPQLCTGQDVLEIGAGTGVLALAAAKNGARRVVATDINREAVRNIRENQARAGLHFPVYEGSLFAALPIPQKFDVIFWNHPFQKTETEPDNSIEASVSDFQYRHLRAYFREGFHYLSEQGNLLLCTGNLAECLPDILALAEEENVRLELLTATRISSFKGATLEMELGIYRIRQTANVHNLSLAGNRASQYPER